VKQFETSLEDGGDFDLQRYFVSVRATRFFPTRWSVGASFYYGRDDYGFGEGSPFAGGEAPWEKIHELRVGLPLIHRGERWTTVAIPSLRYRRESGAAWSDSQELGLLAGTAYRFSDNLRLGPGLGVITEIEDNASIFPILLVEWQITDQLSLETGRGPAASRGPGLTLQWQPNALWKLAFGVRYENIRFRLDDSGTYADGVGQNRAIPVNLALSYEPDPDLELTLLGGLAYAGELQLEDAKGELIQDSEYDAASFLGLTVKIKL
jgi:hypothetical protein